MEMQPNNNNEGFTPADSRYFSCAVYLHKSKRGNYTTTRRTESTPVGFTSAYAAMMATTALVDYKSRGRAFFEKLAEIQVARRARAKKEAYAQRLDKVRIARIQRSAAWKAAEAARLEGVALEKASGFSKTGYATNLRWAAQQVQDCLILSTVQVLVGNKVITLSPSRLIYSAI